MRYPPNALWLLQQLKSLILWGGLDQLFSQSMHFFSIFGMILFLKNILQFGISGLVTYIYYLIMLFLVLSFLSLSPIIDRQLHLFTDASEKGYGGVVYLRSIHEDTSISVTLLTSKARVTPVRKQTIPKLELSGREGVRLLKSTARDLNISTEHLFCWTDSMVVLGWLSKPDKYWKQFVTVRVCEILSVVFPLYSGDMSLLETIQLTISPGD